jgi:methionyl-tRNA formyltransferase
MRVVFLGTPIFAVPAFRVLLDHSYEICGVFTQPDRPSGRGQKLQPSPVKALAQAHGIPVFQPDGIRKEENRAILEELRPDFIVVAAYGQILPEWLLRSPRLAPVNIHASLLPRYRGAAPIPWAILNGDSITGVTTMVILEKLDSGPILLQQEVPIPPTKTAGELAADLSMIGANLLIPTLDGLRNNTLKPKLQDESQVTWAPRITKEMARISWERCALDIHNQIRAMNPWPVALTAFRDKLLHIWRSMPADQSTGSAPKPGTFLGVSTNGIRVQCGESSVLELLEVQLPAKDRVSGREFAIGARLHAGELLFG